MSSLVTQKLITANSDLDSNICLIGHPTNRFRPRTDLMQSFACFMNRTTRETYDASTSENTNETGSWRARQHPEYGAYLLRFSV